MSSSSVRVLGNISGERVEKSHLAGHGKLFYHPDDILSSVLGAAARGSGLISALGGAVGKDRRRSRGEGRATHSVQLEL
ncbi:hypothetical protein EYF80_025946 [Liparis tanakae]|uniref:Uncharacterized protein n=1 Tax=Liparis tanakae TaxID=230148 RepID=A0A4Z2HD76_9TELE|nr:hypothetical protein EYF80_025946 [Liparis tanakae]